MKKQSHGTQAIVSNLNIGKITNILMMYKVVTQHYDLQRVQHLTKEDYLFRNEFVYWMLREQTINLYVKAFMFLNDKSCLPGREILTHMITACYPTCDYECKITMVVYCQH